MTQVQCPQNYESIASKQAAAIADVRRVGFVLHAILMDTAFFWPRVPLDTGGDTPLGLPNADILILKFQASKALVSGPKLTTTQIKTAMPNLVTWYALLGIDVQFIRLWVPALLPFLRAIHRTLLFLWQREYRPDITMVDLQDLEFQGLLDDKQSVGRLRDVRNSRISFNYQTQLRTMISNFIDSFFAGLVVPKYTI
jgi:hypothetical protein